MTDTPRKPPERIWIDWPRKQADDAWYWTHDEYGHVEFVRADLARTPSVSPQVDDERLKAGSTIPEKCIHCEESITVLHSVSMLEECYEGYMHHERAADTVIAALSLLAAPPAQQEVERLRPAPAND